ncbi:MAG: hypothetical protein IPI69_02870 [Bacteroidales bacterium]|nr:hypothetical protein [Bacteroidales bacterium]
MKRKKSILRRDFLKSNLLAATGLTISGGATLSLTNCADKNYQSNNSNLRSIRTKNYSIEEMVFGK